MAAMDLDASASRRPPRKVQKILPKVNFVSDSEEDDSSIGFSRPSKKPKVELESHASNAVKFTSTRKSTVILDSEDSDGFIDIDDSEDSDFAIAVFRSRTKDSSSSRAKAFKAGSSSGQPNKFKAAKLLKAEPSTLKQKQENVLASTVMSESELDSIDLNDTDLDGWQSDVSSVLSSDDGVEGPVHVPTPARQRSRRQVQRDLALMEDRTNNRAQKERARLEAHHPELHTMWNDLENLPKIGDVTIEQPKNIHRELKPFQLEGVAWMKAMEKTEWGGGLLGDEMGMGKTIQAVSLIMSDWPAKQPSLVLIPPVALMQWQQEIADYTDGTLKTFVFHGTNAQTKDITVSQLQRYDVILMSYNSLESMYRKQEKGFKRKNGIHKQKSPIHQIRFHRVVLDEAHNIKVSTIYCRCGTVTKYRTAKNYRFCQGMFCFEGRP